VDVNAVILKPIPSIDLHGYLVSAAAQVFFQKLNQARMDNKLVEINFITGSGKIQQKFIELATQNELKHYIPMQNRGCIIIEFE